MLMELFSSVLIIIGFKSNAKFYDYTVFRIIWYLKVKM